MRLATLCYVDNGKQFLLLHRNKKPQDIHAGKWLAVGGKFEKGETPEACVIREVKEETGLTIEHPLLKGVLTFPNFDGVQDWYVFVFVAKQFSGELIDSPEGTLAWVDYADVLHKPTWEGDYIFNQWLLDQRPFFSAVFCYEHNQLMTHSVQFYT